MAAHTDGTLNSSDFSLPSRIMTVAAAINSSALRTADMAKRKISDSFSHSNSTHHMELRSSKKVSSNKKPRLDPERNIVSWTLSGKYDRKKRILIDADDDTRFVSLGKAVRLVASLTGAWKPDSTVCLHLANDIVYPVLALGIFASNCRWTGTNPSYKAPELEHHFKTSRTKYVVTRTDRLSDVEEAVKMSKTGAEIILFGDMLQSTDSCCQTIGKERNYRCLHDLLEKRTEREMWTALEAVHPDSIATMASTSGTTGLPKIAERTQKAIVFESKAMADELATKPYDVRRLFCTPIFHAFSTPDMMINALRLGIPSYFTQRFHVDTFAEMVQQFDITETFAPPAMLLMLANAPDSAEKIQTLRTIFTGGSPFTEELRAKFNKLFPRSQLPVITPVWGMTEIGWITTLKWSKQEITNSVGRLPSGYKIKYGDAFDRLSNGQEVFELLVKSQSVMSGYHGNRKATQGAFEHGWLKTGDVGYVDSQGRVFLVDRAKDLIKVNGFQVSPTEVGDALLKSPDVKDAAVVGAGWGTDEHPVAFVVRADGSPEVSADNIKNQLLQKLVRYKVQKCEIRFLEEIPKNPTGKIDRKELRRLAESP